MVLHLPPSRLTASSRCIAEPEAPPEIQLKAEPTSRGGLTAWQKRVITAYIDEHLADPLPLATLSSLVRLSPFHFCRVFRQSFGDPPRRYHAAQRIERAKMLLGNPDLSITAIGVMVGFRETSSFTKAFRRTAGLPPSDFRRKLADTPRV